MEETRTTLLIRLKNGEDQTAWRIFDQLYRPLIVNYSRARGLTTHDSEDVAQQCMQAILDKIGEYQHQGSLRSWLRAIAQNKICDRFRAIGREVQAGTAVWADKPDPNPAPDRLWEQHWWKAHLQQGAEVVRGEVAQTTFAAFVCYAIEGQSAEKVAQSLGMSVNQVYVAKHRVLDRIRALITEWTGEAPAEGCL